MVHDVSHTRPFKASLNRMFYFVFNGRLKKKKESKTSEQKKVPVDFSLLFYTKVLGHSKSLSPQNPNSLKQTLHTVNFGGGEGIISINDLFHFLAFYDLVLQCSVAEVHRSFFLYYFLSSSFCDMSCTVHHHHAYVHTPI